LVRTRRPRREHPPAPSRSLSGPREEKVYLAGSPANLSTTPIGNPATRATIRPGENYVAINWEFSDDPPRGIKGDWNDTPLNGTTGYGGKSDGPYFGLVERETDPTQPIPWHLNKTTFHLILLIALAVILLIYFICSPPPNGKKRYNPIRDGNRISLSSGEGRGEGEQ